jgi:hypothetical protein
MRRRRRRLSKERRRLFLLQRPRSDLQARLHALHLVHLDVRHLQRKRLIEP